MRKLPLFGGCAAILLAVALAALPAHAGLGSLFKAAGSFADDAAKTGARAGSHGDDAVRTAGHLDDGRHADGAVVVDTAAHGDDGARAGREGGSGGDAAGELAKTAAEAAIGVGADLAGGEDAPERKAASPVDRETLKHARRLALIDGLDRVALETNDAALKAKAARIREKERVRHIEALTKMAARTP